MKDCIVCGKQSVMIRIDFGKQPVSSHYLADPKKTEYTHELSLGQCTTCGVIQLFDPFPWKKLVPHFPWTIRYAEPEKHLDELVQSLFRLPGISTNSRMCGLSFKDISLVTRLKNRGCINAFVLRSQDLGIRQTLHGVETVQHHLTPNTSSVIRSNHGSADIVIIRHVLEHAYNPIEVIAALRKLVRPGGYIVIEVPTIDKALHYFDYTTAWEEHVLYFTKVTFRSFLELAGLTILFFQEISYPLENSIVAIAQNSPVKSSKYPNRKTVIKERQIFDLFASKFNSIKTNLHIFFMDHQSAVLFGAGHLGCVWVNIFHLKRYIEAFIDEDTHKSGYYSPGNHIPIIPPQEYTGGASTLCLLSANPDVHENLLKKQRLFFHRFVKVASIFPQIKGVF